MSSLRAQPPLAGDLLSVSDLCDQDNQGCSIQSCQLLDQKFPFQPQEWVVFAGPASSASILHMEADTQVMIVKDILRQPGSRHLQHVSSRDLALISLHEPLSFSPSLGAACIRSEEEDRTEQQCVIVGWRKEANGNSDIIEHSINYNILT